MTKRKQSAVTPPQDAPDDNAPPPVPPSDDEIRRRAELLRIAEDVSEQRAARAEVTPTLPYLRTRSAEAAERVFNAFFQTDGIPNLVVLNDDAYTRWQQRWSKKTDKDIDKLLLERFRRCMVENADGEGRNFQATPAELSTLKMHLLSNLARVLSDRVPPLEYKNDEWVPVNGRGWIATRGELVNIITWKTKPGGSIFTPTCAEWEYVPDPPPPERFLAYLDSEQIFGDRRQMLLEFIGYVLSGDNDLRKAMMIIGPPHGGKSKLLDLMACLVGQAANVSPSLMEFGKDFGISMLQDKLLCTITDASVANRTDVLAVVEFIKKLTGADTFTFRRAYAKDHTTVKLGARIMIAANELPNLYGGTKALQDRFLMMQWTETFEGAKDDTGLLSAMCAEAAGIVRMAGQAYAALRKRGVFTVTHESRAMSDAWYKSTDPIADFADDCLELAPGEREPSSAVLDRHKEWCEAHGMKPTNGRHLSGKLVTHYGSKRVQLGKSGNQRFIVGIRLLPKQERF